MSRAGRWVLSMLLWTWGGTAYYFLEVVWKLLREEPERISWTMLVVAVILCIPVERCGAELPWSCPLWLQALCCAILVTAVELMSGLILNLWLGLNIWDYTDLPGNFLGQICPQFSALWWGLCLMFIPVFDWLRWTVEGGTKPHYTMRIFALVE